MDVGKRYAINEAQISHKDFGDEVVVIHFETGNYYSLRATGATLWKRLTPAPASAVTLLAAFADPPAEAASQIGEFLASLHARGLIVDAAGDLPTAPAAMLEALPYTRPELEAFEDLQALLVADVIHDTDERGWPHLAPPSPAEPA